MITIASNTFDIDGHVQINPLDNTTDGATNRRVSRVATLDGGVAVIDRGYAEGDRDLFYSWRSVSKEHSDSVDRIVRLYTRVTVSTPDGVYLAAPQTFTPGVEESSLSLLVIDKIT